MTFLSIEAAGGGTVARMPAGPVYDAGGAGPGVYSGPDGSPDIACYGCDYYIGCCTSYSVD